MDLVLVESPQYYLNDLPAYEPGLARVAGYAREHRIPVRVPDGDVVTYLASGAPYPRRVECVAEPFEEADYGVLRGEEEVSGLRVLLTGGAFELERRRYRYYLGEIAGEYGIETRQLRNFHPDGEFAFVWGEVADRAFQVAHEARQTLIHGASTYPGDEALDGLWEVHAFGQLRGNIGYLMVRRTAAVPELVEWWRAPLGTL